jgi:sugar O-acyltransferase (sialic acid O-acetyltransferase NeuD family)
MAGVLAIIGANGHGRSIADCAVAGGWEQVVFFDDAWPDIKESGHWKVQGDTFGFIDRLSEFDSAIIGIGDNKNRVAKFSQLISAGARIDTLIHHGSIVSEYAKIGVGSVVLAGAVINVDAILGQAVIVNTGATIDHDCVLGDGVHISPGANLAGNVTVGEGTWIGIGASVKQEVTIGSNVMVAAGAVVVCDIPDGTTVMGVPARRIKEPQ